MNERQASGSEVRVLNNSRPRVRRRIRLCSGASCGTEEIKEVESGLCRGKEFMIAKHVTHSSTT